MRETTSQCNAAHGELIENQQTGNSSLTECIATHPAEPSPISLVSVERANSKSPAQRRVENIQLLIDELSKRSLLFGEIVLLLKFTPSGTRKYIGDLRAAGVIERAPFIKGTVTSPGNMGYQLSPDTERVRVFLEAIGQGNRDFFAKRKKHAGLVERSTSGAGRRFHILADDEHFAVRGNLERVTRDPLVAALFGAARIVTE